MSAREKENKLAAGHLRACLYEDKLSMVEGIPSIPSEPGQESFLIHFFTNFCDPFKLEIAKLARGRLTLAGDSVALKTG